MLGQPCLVALVIDPLPHPLVLLQNNVPALLDLLSLLLSLGTEARFLHQIIRNVLECRVQLLHIILQDANFLVGGCSLLCGHLDSLLECSDTLPLLIRKPSLLGHCLQAVWTASLLACNLCCAVSQKLMAVHIGHAKLPTHGRHIIPLAGHSFNIIISVCAHNYPVQ